LKDKGARFGARGGWERAVYFPAAGDEAAGPALSFRRPGWHRAVARECAAVQERVAVLDLPGFTKFEVTGRDAAAWISQWSPASCPSPAARR